MAVNQNESVITVYALENWDTSVGSPVKEEQLHVTLDEELADGWTKGVVNYNDDPDTPALTVRMLVLGTIWGIFAGFVDTVLTFRYQAIAIPSTVIIILSYPMGVFLASVLPKGHLNPGPFSVKELALVWIIGSSAGGQPYGLYNVVGQSWVQFMGNRSITYWNSIPWVLSTQLIGYGAAGIARTFLVYPKAMLWPTVLPFVTLFNSFFESNSQSSYRLSRFSCFWVAFGFMFLYQWLPSYFLSAISMVSLLCLFPNKTLRWLGSSGANEGVGLFSLSFDWSVANGLGAMYTPWWAGLNSYGGYILFSWILVPLIHVTNPFGVPGGYESQSYLGFDGADPTVDPFPRINSAGLFGKTGKRVKVDTTQLLNPDYTLNETYYESVKPVYLTAGFTISYFSSFCTLGALVSHVSLWYGGKIYAQAKDLYKNGENTHRDELNQMISVYPEVPNWVYWGFMGGFTALSIFSGLFTEYKMSILSTLSAVVLGLVFLVPIGIIQAISGTQIGLNVLTQLFAGLAMPGNTVGVMCFKTLGYDMIIQGLNLSSSQKIGHYLHIPPRAMFLAQFLGTIIGVFVNTYAVFWSEIHLQEAFLTRPTEWFPVGYTTFTNAAGIWGSIGPARFFGVGAIYSPLLWGFLIGFVLPFLPWACNRYYPNPNWHLVNIPLIVFNGNLTGANQSVIFMSIILCYIFNKYVHDRYTEWWSTYTFMIGFGFDTGSAITSIIVLAFISSGILPPTGPLNPAGSFADYYCIGLYWQNDTGPATINI
ncbi:OPT oligopeptide transporter protein-domain-containing protein [Globomyces pollinis-pini]|nr:OPT oligopeptide transporter protein-domain-containing protein [Globomyces pollinis-pini]